MGRVVAGRRNAVALVLAALAVATTTAGCSKGSGATDANVASTTPLHGATVESQSSKPALTLVDTSGARYDLDAETRGKVTLLFFGYTHCPDECPTSMADAAQALRMVSPSVAAQVKVVFVTTDPWRDTRSVLRRWLDRFSPSFVGLTGTPTQIAGAEVRVGMPISRREPAKKSDHVGGYSVNHFAAVFAYGRDGRLETLYPSQVPPADIAADLPVLAKE